MEIGDITHYRILFFFITHTTLGHSVLLRFILTKHNSDKVTARKSIEYNMIVVQYNFNVLLCQDVSGSLHVTRQRIYMYSYFVLLSTVCRVHWTYFGNSTNLDIKAFHLIL